MCVSRVYVAAPVKSVAVSKSMVMMLNQKKRHHADNAWEIKNVTIQRLLTTINRTRMTRIGQIYADF